MKTYEVLALTNGYFQVMANTQDIDRYITGNYRYWVPVGWEYPTIEQAQAEADRRNDREKHKS